MCTPKAGGLHLGERARFDDYDGLVAAGILAKIELLNGRVTL